MKFRNLLFISIVFPVLSMAQISDTQIPSKVQQYFKMNRKGPTLVSTEVVNNHQSGRTIKLKIVANRNSKGKDLAFAFAAAAAVINRADKPFELIWVEMDINFKDLETTMVIAPAMCTIDAIILKNVDTDKWWEDCLQFP